eukprot:9502052-Pyramimonas_sp.AAC.1
MDSNLITHKGRHRDGVRGIQENPQGTDRACDPSFKGLPMMPLNITKRVEEQDMNQARCCYQWKVDTQPRVARGIGIPSRCCKQHDVQKDVEDGGVEESESGDTISCAQTCR